MNPATNYIKHAFKGLILLSAAVAFSACFAEDSGQKAFQAAARKVLVAAEQGKAVAPLRDRRLFISEMSADEFGADAVQVANSIAAASVEISGATLNGERLNTFTGTGFLYGSRCHVVSVRHNVNKGVARGRDGVKLNHNLDPSGATVVIRHGLNGQSQIVGNSGTVLSVGSFGDGIDGDFGLIRLDKPAPAKLAPIFLGDASDLVGAKMMAFGLPADKRSSGSEKIVVDPNCKAIKSSVLGISTNCIGASGNSGGPVAGLIEIDARGNKAWGIVGMAVEVLQAPAGSAARASFASGHIHMLNLKEINPILKSDIKFDLARNPCR